jgi:hypothetical protein
MKRLIAIVALLYCVPLHAQQTREIGVFAEQSFFALDVSHGQRIGIQYKYQPDTKKAYRFSASVAKMRISSWENARYYSKDTFFSVYNSWYIITNMPIVSSGIQWNKKLSKRMSWYYGADVNVGFKTSKKDSIAFFDLITGSSGNSGSLFYYSSQRSEIQANIFYSGVQPFTGISAKWNRINTGMEVSGLFVGSIVATIHEQKKSFERGGYTLRVFVSYTIDKMSKKQSAAVQ